MKYKKNSVRGGKKMRPLHEVSIPKVILQAQNIFHGKWPTIILSFFTAIV